MSVNPSPLGGFAGQFFDNNGVILSGGKIYTYAAGTTTPQATYTSNSGVTTHANPIVLDSAGRVPGGEIWLTTSLPYKFVIETSLGVLLGTYDNVIDISSINADVVVYDPPYANATATTAEAALGNVLMRDTFANNTTYLAAASTLSTGGFWLDELPQPRFWRFADRVFIDAAASEAPGTKFPIPGEGTFLTTQMGADWMERGASTLSVSSYGEFGGVFAARSSDKANSSYYGDATIGVLGIATNDDTGPSLQLVWGGYFEANRDAGADTSFGIEIAVKNKGINVENYPNLRFPGGSTIGIWLAGGGDASYYGAPANPCTNAILIGKNSASWNKGIVFTSDGITGTDGVTGTGTAIAMAKGHVIGWYNNTNSECAAIYSAADDPTKSMSMAFVNDQVQILGASGGFVAIIGRNTGVANHIRLFSEATGNAPSVQANGTDTNVDLLLTPKGTGKLSFGALTGSADAPITGYIEIKDSSGNLRKLAVIS